MKYYRSANRWESSGASCLPLGTIASLQAIGTGSLSAGFLSHCSCADVNLSLKEDLDCRPDLAVSCCLWRAAAGALFSAPPALQFSPPCGSARWFSGPGRLSSTPSCAEIITKATISSENVLSDSVVLNDFY